MSDNTIKQRIEKLIDKLSEGLHERREQAAVVLLAALSGQNTFMLGPPGTAKSLLARRLASVFVGDNAPYFEYLMQRYSTPEDIFGPVSIAALKDDKYNRKTEGFLPTAHFAFLDEIWKSGPGILNTLLTIINEKKFRNGTEIEDVPLKALIAASNETPPDGQGLEALYDRFTVRLYAPPIKGTEVFEKFLCDKKGVGDKVDCDDIAIKSEEWEKWRKEMREVELSPETMQIIRAIRLKLSKKQKKMKVYVSDRRWKKAALLLQAGAYFCGRNKTNLVDTLLLRHCLWTTEENREQVAGIVEESVLEFGFVTELSSAQIVTEKSKIDKEINEELLYTQDVYKTTKGPGEKEYFCGEVEHSSYGSNTAYYVPVQQMKSGAEFHPIDEHGNEIKEFECTFRNQGSFVIKATDGRKVKSPTSDYENEIVVKPQVQFHKGDRKKVNARLIDGFEEDTKKIARDLDGIIGDIEKQKGVFETETDTPFVDADDKAIAFKSINAQLQRVSQERKDCDRLLDIIGKSE